MKYALFVGRFQPFHKGHQWLIAQKLDKGIPVLIAIRDVKPDDENPYSAGEVWTRIRKFYGHRHDVRIMSIPDIESINWGRGVGYEVNEFLPPEGIGEISATKIRAET